MNLERGRMTAGASWLAAGLLAAALLPSGCARAPAEPPAPRPVQTMTVALIDRVAMDAYSGEVRAAWEADLSFRVGGKLIRRPVELGQAVRRGQVLARLDAADLELAARARGAALAAAETDLKTAEAELARHRELRDRGLIGASLYDAKQNAVDVARARLEQARAEQSVSRNQRRYAELTADRDGVVTAILAEPGQVVAAGQPVLRLAVPDRKEVWIAVPEERVAQVRVGMPAYVVLSADRGRHYRGEVRDVAARADAATRTYATKVALLEADAAVALGMSALVALGLSNGDAPRVAVIPRQAVLARDGVPQVWVVDPESGVVTPRPVELGDWTEDGATILSGLAGGERVVTAGVQRLVPGQAVRLLDGPKQP